MRAETVAFTKRFTAGRTKLGQGEVEREPQ
jgi:hypothetical protein